jgi:hypothetical protein
MSKPSISAVILTGTNDLWAGLEQPILLGLVLAATWKAKPLIVAAGATWLRDCYKLDLPGKQFHAVLPSGRGALCPIGGRGNSPPRTV